MAPPNPEKSLLLAPSGPPVPALHIIPEIQLHPLSSPEAGGGGNHHGGGAPTQSNNGPAPQQYTKVTTPSSEHPVDESVVLRPDQLKPPPEKLTLIPVIFLIYFEVAGGPYGAEGAVRAAGPLLTLLGFLVLPFFWGVPESLVTAELATALPANGGFVVWADAAFGPFAGSLMGWWKFLSSVINSASFPIYCADYLARAAPALAGGPPRAATLAGMNLLLPFLNYLGLTVVGYAAVGLGVASLAPFALMSAAALPKLRPRRWLGVVGKRERDWRLFLNVLFWNLNFWDSASTMAGEVARPETTFPRALLVAVVGTSVSYLVPLMAATGALDVPPEAWVDGFFADAAGMIAGNWLKSWIEVGAALSAIGMYEAQLSSSAFQLLGMANLGLLPRVFASRSKWFDTPWVGILTSSLIILAISFMSFDDVISLANFLYNLGMLMEFAAFLRLRQKFPDLRRPYRVPMHLPGLVCMCLVPLAFLITVMAMASRVVFGIASAMTLFGIGLHYVMRYCRATGFLEFVDGERIIKEETDQRKDEV